MRSGITCLMMFRKPRPRTGDPRRGPRRPGPRPPPRPRSTTAVPAGVPRPPPPPPPSTPAPAAAAAGGGRGCGTPGPWERGFPAPGLPAVAAEPAAPEAAEARLQLRANDLPKSRRSLPYPSLCPDTAGPRLRLTLLPPGLRPAEDGALVPELRRELAPLCVDGACAKMLLRLAPLEAVAARLLSAVPKPPELDGCFWPARSPPLPPGGPTSSPARPRSLANISGKPLVSDSIDSSLPTSVEPSDLARSAASL